MYIKVSIFVLWLVVIWICKKWRDSSKFHSDRWNLLKYRFFQWWQARPVPFDPFHICDGIIITSSALVILFLIIGNLIASLIATALVWLLFYTTFKDRFDKE